MKTIYSRVAACALASLTLLLGACTTTVASRPELVSAGMAAPLVKGKATLVMTQEDVLRTIKASPTSLTGSATSINVPVGQILRGVGEKILDAGFSEGTDVAAKAEPNSWSVAVSISKFTYAYDQLSSLGFAITPKVSVGFDADVVGPDGTRILRKNYERNDFTTGKYVASMKPAEKINEGLHLALGDLFRQLMDDIASAPKE